MHEEIRKLKALVHQLEEDVKILTSRRHEAEEHYRALREAIEARRTPTPGMMAPVAAQWGRKTLEQFGEVHDVMMRELP